MTTLTLLDVFDRPSILGPDPGVACESEALPGDRTDGAAAGGVAGCSPVGGVPTLDEVLTGTWEALTAGAPATCLVCDGPLEPRYGAGHGPVGGRCRHCGSELS